MPRDLWGTPLQPAQLGPLKDLSEAATRRAGPGEAGILLLDRNAEALQWRLVLIDSASQSLDLQYYLWKGDAVGALLARHIHRAADRGVRVRVLIDDFLLTRDDTDEEGFHHHPNIDILAIGPVVLDLAETFDDFWNDEWNHPIEILAGQRAAAMLSTDGSSELTSCIKACL